MELRVVIVEDEKPAARRLSRMLSKLNVNVIQMLHSVSESIEWFSNNELPDLILLDIQLSDGLSFEIFDEIEITSAIIFTTAYDEYALKAFKLNSIDYLLKPIDKNELEIAINKYQTFRPKNQTEIFDSIKKLLVNPLEKQYKNRFSVKVGQHIKLIDISDVECFYSENKATYMHLINGRNYIVDFTLEEIEDLINPELFFRINRQSFVNINGIKDIINYSNSRLKIILKKYSENELIVSRERVKSFKKWIG